MFIYAGAALLTTMIIGYLYETLREILCLRAVKRLNAEIAYLLSGFTLNEQALDVFEVNNLRNLFKEKLMDCHKIDDFRLYKKDNRHVEMTFRKHMVIQSLELTLDTQFRDVAVGLVEIIENPFEEIHL